MIRATILDYGAGNLHSLSKALAMPDVTVRIVADPSSAIDTDVLILPGVGAFTGAADKLAPGRAAMRRALDNGLSCLGICLGMQLLFDGSDEGPGTGLGLIAGRVERLRTPLVPHMGWKILPRPRKLLTRCTMRATHLFPPLRSRRRTTRTASYVAPWMPTRRRRGPRPATSGSPPSCVEGILSACSSIPKKARPPACGSFTPF